MEEWMEELYQKARRFDEGDLYQRPEHARIAKRQMELYTKMRVLFDPLIGPLLEEYTTQIGEEFELECRHFFMQGYLMGKEQGADG